jgi:hypothetical protein
MSMRYIIVLRTDRGEFYYNHANSFAAWVGTEQSIEHRRTYGWMTNIDQAQLYQRRHAAVAQAQQLERDWTRLFRCEITVQAVTVRTENNRQRVYKEATQPCPS